MERDGRYNSREIAKKVSQRDDIPEWVKDKALLIYLTAIVAEQSTRRTISGVSRSIWLGERNQYRLRNWCTFSELLADLSRKIELWQADGEAILLDASQIMSEFPDKKAEVLLILPVGLRPETK